jgi:hypothetical protein
VRSGPDLRWGTVDVRGVKEWVISGRLLQFLTEMTGEDADTTRESCGNMFRRIPWSGADSVILARFEETVLYGQIIGRIGHIDVLMDLAGSDCR